MRTILATALSGFFMAARLVSAAETPPELTTKSATSVEERLEQLEAGQRQLLDELAEMRRLLEQRSEATGLKPAPPRPGLIPLDVRGEPFRGQADARVAILEYSDFACPYCAKYAREVYPLVDSNYIQSGKVKYYFRDLPELGHTHALLAAQAARCAGEEGKFWEMHDLLFAAQPALSEPDLARYAAGIGLDEEKFQVCLSSGRWAESIRRSAAGARQMELYGTPAFLIGTISEDGNVVRATKVVVGGGSFGALKSALDEVLGQPSKSPLAQVSGASRPQD